MDEERIKRRIRALLNLAGDNAAAEGEIDNAMRMAAELMNEHHISREDIAAEAVANGAATEPTPKMGQADGVCGTARLSTWESTLSWAITRLVGSVKHYVTSASVPISGTFSARAGHRAVIRFYGPAEDAALAAGLFDEWRSVIATMAAGNYGGCWRGDGAKYAYGFACALSAKAAEAEKARATMPATSSAIVLASGKTLAQALDQHKALATKWLAESQGVRLSGRGGGGGGYRSGSRSAFDAGKSDGSRADFAATRKHKLPA